MNVTFIGLGIMGSRMARNLLNNNVKLTIYNRSDEPARALEQRGALRASSASEAVREADVVFTMLSSPEVVTEVVTGPAGFLPSMQKRALWVDCSTVNPSFSRTAREAAAQQQLRFIDAPVAGTKPQAELAELVFFVGGDQSDLAEVEPLLNFMGQKVMPIGDVGQGTSFKMLVNVLLAQSMVLFSETLLLGEKMGLDKNFLLDTLPNLAVSAPFTKAKAEMIRNNNYEVQFPLELMYKDLHLAALTAYEHQQPLYLANLAKELYGRAVQNGMGRQDFAAVHQELMK
jgi:3-hydroxyisobutyrate dehydrogenase-like beta-hydroxyacid dehydrogenase